MHENHGRGRLTLRDRVPREALLHNSLLTHGPFRAGASADPVKLYIMLNYRNYEYD